MMRTISDTSLATEDAFVTSTHRTLLSRLGSELRNAYGDVLDAPLTGRLSLLVQQFEQGEGGPEAGSNGQRSGALRHC